MLVRELLSVLLDADPDAVVVLSSDAEGNSYHKAIGASLAMKWVEEDQEIALAELTEEAIAEGYSEEDVAPADAEKAVVLWP